MKKLTNTWKHAIGGALLGYIAIPVSFYPQLAVFVAIGVLFCLVAWENAQYQRGKKAYNDMIKQTISRKIAKPFKWNWLDAIVDVVVGYLAFSIFYWLIILISK